MFFNIYLHQSAFQQRSRTIGAYIHVFGSILCNCGNWRHSQHVAIVGAAGPGAWNPEAGGQEGKMEVTREKEEWTEAWEAEAEATRKGKNLHEALSPSQPLTWVMGVCYKGARARHHRINMCLTQAAVTLKERVRLGWPRAPPFPAQGCHGSWLSSFRVREQRRHMGPRPTFQV